MDFWSEQQAENSWKVLQQLKGKLDFILIGGWAAYLLAKLQKSVDIDIILDLKELDKCRKMFDVTKNDNLRKYQIKIEGVDIDIYVPFYSKLPIPAERLAEHATAIESFTVLKPEALLILKQAAEQGRRASAKGQKDRIDIMGLLIYASPDLEHYKELLRTYKLEEYKEELKEMIRTFDGYKYLGLNQRQLKLKKKELLGEL
ncbi:hypothetical protein HYV82_00225 [Candidatus Woesearchaeota archaeon]|nr:hypothetical protein [Candidatus Woesearchaeota archaeon]